MKKLPRKKSPLALHQEAIRVLTTQPLTVAGGAAWWTTQPSITSCPEKL